MPPSASKKLYDSWPWGQDDQLSSSFLGSVAGEQLDIFDGRWRNSITAPEVDLCHTFSVVGRPKNMTAEVHVVVI